MLALVNTSRRYYKNEKQSVFSRADKAQTELALVLLSKSSGIYASCLLSEHIANLLVNSCKHTSSLSLLTTCTKLRLSQSDLGASLPSVTEI